MEPKEPEKTRQSQLVLLFVPLRDVIVHGIGREGPTIVHVPVSRVKGELLQQRMAKGGGGSWGWLVVIVTGGLLLLLADRQCRLGSGECFSHVCVSLRWFGSVEIVTRIS